MDNPHTGLSAGIWYEGWQAGFAKARSAGDRMAVANAHLLKQCELLISVNGPDDEELILSIVAAVAHIHALQDDDDPRSLLADRCGTEGMSGMTPGQTESAS